MNWKLVLYFLQNYGDKFLEGALVTLWISLFGTIAGLGIGLIVGIIRTIPKSKNKVFNVFINIINFLLKVYVEIFRGTPMMVQAMLIYYGSKIMFGFELNRMTAALFIVSINTGAYMTELVRGGIMSIDKGQFEAASAIGMNHFQTMIYIILPQTLKNILPVIGNEFVINIKDTSVLNLIQVSELFYITKSIAGAYTTMFEAFFITSVIYFVMTFTITRILRYIERRLEGKADFIMAGNQMQV